MAEGAASFLSHDGGEEDATDTEPPRVGFASVPPPQAGAKRLRVLVGQTLMTRGRSAHSSCRAVRGGRAGSKREQGDILSLTRVQATWFPPVCVGARGPIGDAAEEFIKNDYKYSAERD